MMIVELTAKRQKCGSGGGGVEKTVELWYGRGNIKNMVVVEGKQQKRGGDGGEKQLKCGAGGRGERLEMWWCGGGRGKTIETWWWWWWQGTYLLSGFSSNLA